MASTALIIKDWRKDIPGRLSDDRKVYLFPKITSTNAHGKQTEWRIIVRLYRDNGQDPKALPEADFLIIDDVYFDNKAMPQDIHGWIKVLARAGEDGKIRDSVPTVVKKGKNVGRANETNVFCQTLRDALSLHNKQLKKAISENVEGKTPRYPPMLAKTLKDLKKPLNYAAGVYVQPKYNGVRTVTTLDTTPEGGEFAIMYGRRKLLYPGFGYLKAELLPVLKYYWEEGRQLYLDGEIYKHGMRLQDISGYARREDQPDDVKVDYMIYDCFIANEDKLTFSQRATILDEIFENFDHLKHTIKAPTHRVTTAEEVTKLYEGFLEEGFEGAMVRLNEPYRYSYNEYHSSILLKMKPTYDDEFTVVGWETGEKGKAAEALMIICETKDKKQFACTPAMEIPDRIALAKKMAEMQPNGKTYFENEYLGKRIRVSYDELSKDGIPQRARTKLERLHLDIIQ